MKLEDKFLERIEYAIQLADEALKTQYEEWGTSFFDNKKVEIKSFTKFKTNSLSLINELYNNKHSYYTNFNEYCKENNVEQINACLGILESIKEEIEKGHLISLRDLIQADFFNDFLDMGEHLLEEGYKDAAAVMVGSTLEQHIKYLANKNGIDLTVTIKGKVIPKKAATLNDELNKTKVYKPSDNQFIKWCLTVRNDAAHGNYEKYSLEQVKIMLSGVREFMVRVS